jgi:hypothetical protein
MAECEHDWPTTSWGVLIGVAKCKKCGKIAQESDFLHCIESDDDEAATAAQEER